MSRLNGKFGIVDDADSSKTIVSLRLTDAALKDILNNKDDDLFIRFEDKDSFKGEIRFSSSSPYGFNSQPRDGVDILCQRRKMTSVSNIGESKQLLKIEANIKSSAERLKQSMNEAEAKEREKVVIAIATKGSRKQPKYLNKRPGNATLTKRPNRPDLDPSSHNRTPTPDPTQTDGHTHGSFRTRLLHILALYDKKQPKLGDIKQDLISRKLTNGLELKNAIEPTIKTLAKERNKRWFINRPLLKDIDPSWTGYKENDKELIAVILADAKNEESKSGNSPLGRKRTGIEASNENDQHNSKRPRAPLPPPSPQDNSSRDSHMRDSPNSPSLSSPSSRQESPNGVMSSAQSNMSDNNSVTPPPISPIPPKKTSLQEQYERKKTKQREQKAKEEKEKRISHEDVQKQDKEQRHWEQHFTKELHKKFPKITSGYTETEYEKRFNESYTVYELLQQKMEAVYNKFDQLEERYRKANEGSQEFKEIYKKSIDEYKRSIDDGFFVDKKKYIEVFLRLRHLKVRLKEWRESKVEYMEAEAINSQD